MFREQASQIFHDQAKAYTYFFCRQDTTTRKQANGLPDLVIVHQDGDLGNLLCSAPYPQIVQRRLSTSMSRYCQAGLVQARSKLLDGPLPLLLANKQIHDEVSSIIDSQVNEVAIGPYGLQYADEDPRVRWEHAYRLLRNRPHLIKNVKSVKVYLPWLRQDWYVFPFLSHEGFILREGHEISYFL